MLFLPYDSNPPKLLKARRKNVAKRPSGESGLNNFATTKNIKLVIPSTSNIELLPLMTSDQSSNLVPENLPECEFVQIFQIIPYTRMDDFCDKLLIELECPVCTNYMAPPIRLCATGHSMCQSCRTKLSKCPLCQEAFTESKNITLEALACKLQYPCVNRPSGCAARLTLEEKQNHEINCSFKSFKCAMDRCTWVGKADDILEHWESKKIKSKTYRSFNICHTKVKSESYYANLVEAHDHLFWCKCKLEKGKIFWVVQFIGLTDKAANYHYDIEVFKPSPTKRPRILFNDYCQAVDIENVDLFIDGVCITTNIDCISRFVGEDQMLIYYLRVYKIENEETTDGSNQGEKSRRNPKKIFNKHRDRSRGATSYTEHNRKSNSQEMESCNVKVEHV